MARRKSKKNICAGRRMTAGNYFDRSEKKFVVFVKCSGQPAKIVKRYPDTKRGSAEARNHTIRLSGHTQWLSRR